MNPLVSQIIGALVRGVLVWLGARLSEHGATPTLVTDLVSSQTQQEVVGWLLVVLPMLWSVWQKQMGLQHIRAAQFLPPDSTMAEIKERAAKPDIAAMDVKRE